MSHAAMENVLQFRPVVYIGDESGTDSNQHHCYTKPCEKHAMNERSERIGLYFAAIVKQKGMRL